MKKTILIGVLCAFVVGFVSAESNWHKVLFGGLEFSIVSQKIDKDGKDERIDCHGIGFNVEYISARKDNGFAFSLKLAEGLDWTKGITDDNNFGAYGNTFAGIGFAPVRTDTFLLAITGGIGLDYYGYMPKVAGVRFGMAGIDFLVGANAAFTWRLTNRIGIGFNLLGTFAFAGVQVIDNNLDDGPKGNDKDIDASYISAGSFSIVPSVGVTVHF